MVSELKHKNSEMMIVHQGELKEQRGALTLDLERLKQSHAQLLSEAKESHLVSQGKLRAEIEASLNTSKEFEIQSYKSTIAELERRVQAKEEEVKSVKHIMDNEGIHAQHITAESVRLREEISEYKGSLETFRLESIIHKDEMNAQRSQMEALQNEYRNLVRVDQNNKEQIKTLTVDLASAKEAHAAVAASLETAQVMIKEYESSSVLHGHESQRITAENTSFKAELQEMTNVARENERLKLSQMQMQGENRELMHVRTSLEEKLTIVEQDRSKLQQQLDSLVARMGDSEEVARTVRQSREQLQAANEELGQKNSRLEAVLEEQRSMLQQCQSELRAERSNREGMESEFSVGEKQLMDSLSKLRGGCDAAFTAMIQWEELLSAVLEPVLFNQSSAAPPSGVSVGSPSNDDTLAMRISTQISVVNKIMSRVQRIRSIFETHVKDAQSASQVKVNTAMDRVLVTNQKLSTIESQHEQLRVVFDRDRKIREDETKDMRHLKEHVFLECGDKIREAEMKYLTLKGQHDQELFVFNQTHAANTAMKEEIVGLKDSVKRLEERVVRYGEMEVEFTQCKLNLTNYMENNKLISYELEDRGKQYQRACDELDNVTEERNQVIEAAERLRMQVTNRDVVISKYEAELSGLNEENKVLRSKQMDPKLAAIIKQSQSLMTSTSGSGNNGRSSYYNGDNASETSMRAPSPQVLSQQQHVQQQDNIGQQESREKSTKTVMSLEVPSTPVVATPVSETQVQSRALARMQDFAETEAAASMTSENLHRNHTALRFSLQELANSNSASQRLLVPSPPKQTSGSSSYHHNHSHSSSIAANSQVQPPNVARGLNFNYNTATSGTPYGVSTRPPVPYLYTEDGSLTPRSRLDHLASSMNNLTHKLDSFGSNPSRTSTPSATSANNGRNEYVNYNNMLRGEVSLRDRRDSRELDASDLPRDQQQMKQQPFSQSQSRAEPRNLAPDNRYLPASSAKYSDSEANQSTVSRGNSTVSSPTQRNSYSNRNDGAAVSTASPFLHFNYSNGLTQQNQSQNFGQHLSYTSATKINRF